MTIEGIRIFEMPQSSDFPDCTDMAAEVKKVEELVEKILDNVIGVQATFLMLKDVKRWNKCLCVRKIAPDSEFGVQFRKAMLSTMIQSLCKLWDPPVPIDKNTNLPKYGQISLPYLSYLLSTEALSVLRDRFNGYHKDPDGMAGHYLSLREEARSTAENFKNEEKIISCWYKFSKLKIVRDKWISHNDLDFEAASINAALDELPDFLNKTVDCVNKINALVRFSGFDWESVSRNIERDAFKFLGETATNP
jgi:hypothetical protein